MRGLGNWTNTRERRKRLRRLARRARHRIPWLILMTIWLVPPAKALTFRQLALNPVGQLVERGREGEAFARTAVVLVPDPAAGTPLDAYAVAFRNLEAEPIREPLDAARWLWVDPDGRFHTYAAARALPYRVLVHREGCEQVAAGTWQSSIWKRRIEITVPPCVPEQ